ncbi:MAG: hypothetical protein AVDCRST_MAG77-2791 [uncultured Chloroflexi bacterium]|uniref:histidine kinase n=1 Tax=uncultured Chloroflexota bacterium TaxID=166587 RepID=A0A6J4J2I3_9CHLR|nr:MAG: hypothetical protein AVDCRST_MAG77-2791 [uncultured Chloroflexota bacterium]
MTFPLRLGSLRSRLLASFAAVILVTLLSAGAAVVWLVQGYRRDVAVNHLQDLAVAIAGGAAQLERQGAQPDEIAAIIAGQLPVASAHVLVTDTQGQVLAEQPSPSGTAFTGRRLRTPGTPSSPGAPTTTGASAAPSHGTSIGPATHDAPHGAPQGALTRRGPSQPQGRPLQASRPIVWSEDVGSGHFILVTAEPPMQVGGPGGPGGPGPRGRPGDRFATPQTRYRVALAIPTQDLASAWRELSLGLGAAAGIAITVAAIAAWILAQSIAQPLRRITRAAEGIAAGQLRQTLAVNGSDEVVQLGHAFNRMSEEVDRSHRSLRDFVANASHELRTPLTSIEGFSQAFVDGMLDEPEDAAEAARVMNEESRRMRRLVDDLLRLSQVEGSDTLLPNAPVDAAALARDAARRLERTATATARDLAVAVDIPDSLITRGDAKQLDQVFMNLLENAGKYAPEGARITVTGRATGRDVVVTVHNTGSYIPPEDLPRVFERFYRVDPARVRAAGDVEGNGLGLAIAHGIVARHGGTLTASSDRDAGTTFTVTLPAHVASSAHVTEHAGPPGHPRISWRRNTRVTAP